MTTAPPRRLRLTALAVFLLGGIAGALGVQAVTVAPPVERTPGASEVLLVGQAKADQEPTTFRMASLNILGHGHTAKGGNKPRYASGPQRIRWQLDVLRDEGVEVVGLQELERPQYAAFTRLAAGEYALWPGGDDPKVLRNSIAWRTDTWTLVKTSRILLPYFHGKQIPMPVVLLRHNVTGQQAYFINFQNPANTRGDATRWRAQGRALQSDLVNRLRDTTGLPVFWTGDLNDRERAFCDVTSRTELKAANGGRNVGGRCTPPKQLAVDWIFGPAEATFTEVSFDRRPAIVRSTDHKLVLATATLPGVPASPCPV